MTEADASVERKDAGGNLGVFRGVLAITENGVTRHVPFEAPASAAHLEVNAQHVHQLPQS